MNASTSPILRNARCLLDALLEFETLSHQELAEIMEIPRSTVYRLVEGMEAVDLVRALPGGRTALSGRWLRLSDAARAAQTEWRDARAAMREVSGRTGCTSYLSVLVGRQSVCLDWAQGRAAEALMLKPGRTLPLYAGAAGRGTLAALPADELQGYLAEAPFPVLTPHTMTTGAQLVEDVARTRAQGYTVSLQDVTLGLGAVGVEVKDPSGQKAAILSLGAFADDIGHRLDELVDELRRAVADLR
ncbi:MAG: IclR family transcriptional regulator [Bifidobacteriaceae bacterium]|jgi:DNA-binding IclR family transcriptional regulator|nr:IclR family transcriptional regulator [Bifidobacteriaceae bacterium]